MPQSRLEQTSGHGFTATIPKNESLVCTSTPDISRRIAFLAHKRGKTNIWRGARRQTAHGRFLTFFPLRENSAGNIDLPRADFVFLDR